MKKYTSLATKWLRVVTLICGAVLLTGMILMFVNGENFGLSIGLILMGALLGVIFLIGYFAEKSRSLIIDTDTITFPRGAEKTEKLFFNKLLSK